MTNISVVLFDLAFVAPPLAVVLGVILLALPSRVRHPVATTHALAR